MTLGSSHTLVGKTLALTVTVLICACGGGGGGDGAGSSANPTPGGAAPPPQGNTPGTPAPSVEELRGTDANANSIRDDVDAAILGLGLTPRQLVQANKFASSLQQTIVNTNPTNAQLAANVSATWSALNCMQLRIPNFLTVARAIEQTTLDTQGRIEAYLATVNQAGGMALQLQSNPTNCD